MNEEITCPYCKHRFYHEAEGPYQDETLFIECPKCEKTFTGIACYEFSIFDIKKADCLNGGDHILKESIGIPSGYPKRYRCKLCDDTGTIERFKKHKILLK